MGLMLFVLYFLAALLALEGAAALLRRRADPARVRGRLQTLAARVSSGDETDVQSILRSRSRFQLPSLKGLELLLYRAGGSMGLQRFFGLSLVLGSCGILALFALTTHPVPSLFGGILGLIPYLWISNLAGRRMRLFDEQLPDSLELITRTIRTGHSLGSGFMIVGEEMPDPIGAEFALVAEELRLGLELRQALDNLARRVGNEDLPYFSTAVLIQRKTGGNLAELLDKLSSLLRQRSQFAGRVKAMTAQGRGAATFLALWLPAMVLAMWIFAPDYFAPLIETEMGQLILSSAFALDAVAYVMARRIADVQA